LQMGLDRCFPRAPVGQNSKAVWGGLAKGVIHRHNIKMADYANAQSAPRNPPVRTTPRPSASALPLPSQSPHSP
jgi:hypothetical protein